MTKTVSGVIPQMVSRGQGYFINVSSKADELILAEVLSYLASKAGLSNYLRGRCLALKPKGINVTKVRFGFVDTKIAKGDFNYL
jgi:short-subunit dehydrogenase